MRDCEARSCGGECETGNCTVQHGPFVHRSATDATILADSSATLTLGLLQGCPSSTRNRFEFANTRHYRQRRAKAPALFAAIEGVPTFSRGQPFNERRVSA